VRSLAVSTQILLSFPPCGQQGEEATERAGSAKCVSIAVTGALVRELRPDEGDIAKRLRLALDSQLPHWAPLTPSAEPAQKTPAAPVPHVRPAPCVRPAAGDLEGCVPCAGTTVPQEAGGRGAAAAAQRGAEGGGSERMDESKQKRLQHKARR